MNRRSGIGRVVGITVLSCGLLTGGVVVNGLPSSHSPFFPEEEYILPLNICEPVSRELENMHPASGSVTFIAPDGRTLVLTMSTLSDPYTERYFAQVLQGTRVITRRVPTPLVSTALADDFGIVFNNLITITNMPIARYATFLRRAGKHEAYMHLLVDNFNPATLNGLMCRTFLSVGWEGLLYDCDFNQMLDMPLPGPTGRPRTIFDAKPADFEGLDVLVGDHCYGCTAGAGSGCAGAITG